MFCPGQHPTARLVTDFGYDDVGTPRHVVKGSQTALPPKLPRDKYDEGSQRLSSAMPLVYHVGPPSFDVIEAMHGILHEVGETEPIPHHSPYPDGEKQH